MRSVQKLTLLIIVVFIAGLFTGMYSSKLLSTSHQGLQNLQSENNELRATLEKEQKQRAALHDELQKIAEVDLVDYMRLKKEEEQFIKAKEILGKVFQVIFHSLLQGSPKEQQDFVNAVTASDAPVAHTPDQGSEIRTTNAPEEPSRATTPAPTEAMKLNPSASWTQIEGEMGTLNPNKADAFLQAATIKDIHSETKGYRKFEPTDTRLTALQGTYTGELIFLDPKKKPWTMEMTVMSDLVDGVPTGSFHFRIINEKGNESNTRGNGNLRELMKPTTPSKALIVRIHETQYLQMYIMENQEIILGNFYDETKVGTIELVGRVKMKR